MFQRVWDAILRWLGIGGNTALPAKQTVPVPSSRSAPPPTASPAPPKPVEPTPPPRLLYQGTGFAITDQHVQEASQYLFRKDASGTKIGPTSHQQKAIFCPSAATAVLAGAGSGKSTTLVSRVLFLHKQMDVPFQNMAVFTFTKKSRQDFIDKLLEEAPRWNIRLSEPGARRLVRTFHSKALQVARDLIGPEEQIFEFLGKEQCNSTEEGTAKSEISKSTDDEAAPPEEEAANQIEGLVRLDDESDEQAEILRDAYADCYSSDEAFRHAIACLLDYTVATEQLPQGQQFEKQLNYLDKMKRIDADLCNHLEERWKRQGNWPIQGVTTRNKDGSRFNLEVMGTPLFANGYIEALDIYVVLGGYNKISKDQIKVGSSQLKPEYDVKDKKLVLLTGCKNKIRFVKNAKDAEELRLQLEHLGGEKGLSAPLARLRLPGEFKSKVTYSALYAFGAFVENLGQRPDKLAENLPASLSTVDRAAIYAVSRYFSSFYSKLRASGLVTFNQIFSRLGKGSQDLDRIGIASLIGIRHLMIDEFQDVSPLIVNFVLGLHGELARKSEGRLTPTLMCVGDDWQSIYGWRGSSPHFFLEFHKHFPGAPSEPLRLEANFRSSQKIIDCGESFIKLVKTKSQKRGIASNAKVKDLPWKVGSIDDYTTDDVKTTLQRLFQLAKPDDDIYLLAASHEQLKPFKTLSDTRLTATTFHQSKGLEAEYVVLLGAPSYFGSNKLKNFIYEQAEFPQTFDEAQQDEAFRVAYVAATRAKKLCLWFAKPKSSDVISAVPADGIHRVVISAGEVSPYIEACF